MKNLYLIFSALLFIACSKNETTASKDGLLPGKSITTRSDGSFFGSKTFTYNDNKLINISFSNAESENAGYAELKYTDELLTRINQFDNSDNLKEYIELKYDANNKLEQYTVYKADQNKAFKILLEYNSNNTVKTTTYSGNIDSQTQMMAVVTYTLDSQSNIIKIETADYQIVYEYDSKNGVYKNLVARDVLNLIGRLHGTLDRGGMNNAISYEFSNAQVTDHIDLNYTYNDKSYPNSLVEVSNEFGEGQHIEYIYN